MSTTSPIAVLGGSGFIGTRLVARLQALGCQVRIGDLNPSQTFPDLQVACDVREVASLRTFLAGAGLIINLAAEHRDDVRPLSRYHETNVEGARNVCQVARELNIQTLIFTSSVAVYGFQSFPVDEGGPFEPFNPYGETKLLAEGIYRAWAEETPNRSLVIIRPTVVFGEGNRGNVYNLLRQIAAGHFMMVGSGTNRKSMAYVGNVAEVLGFSLELGPGTHIFNYTDGPDLNMNELVALVKSCLELPRSIQWRIPMWAALMGGHVLDQVARILKRTFPISAIRIRKFCESTQFKSAKIEKAGFVRSYSLIDGLTATIGSEFKR
jgi:nucleoside-diphosphate-sugar epimerase